MVARGRAVHAYDAQHGARQDACRPRKYLLLSENIQKKAYELRMPYCTAIDGNDWTGLRRMRRKRACTTFASLTNKNMATNKK